MEEYEGIAILATNFRKNMDDAFVRRLHFTVEFPFPDEEDRRRIWQGIWPNDTPLEATLDLELLAARYEMAGGNIKNIALAAAFLAADDGQIVRMSHVVQATLREYQKTGKLIVDEDEFDAEGSPRAVVEGMKSLIPRPAVCQCGGGMAHQEAACPTMT